jgi:VWFA-related protein
VISTLSMRLTCKLESLVAFSEAEGVHVHSFSRLPVFQFPAVLGFSLGTNRGHFLASNGWRRRSRISIITGRRSCFEGHSSGQPSRPRRQEIKFRTQAVLIQVPIIVTDRSGNHIHGLNKENFHVFENGKEQKVATFEEIVTVTTKLAVVRPKPGEFSNLALSDQKPRTITVIALDTINTPFLDQYTGRRALISYLTDNRDSGQVLALMIMTSHGLKVVQGLTADPEQLVQVLKRVSSEQTGMQDLGLDAQANAAVGDIPNLPSANSISANPLGAAAAFLAYGDTLSASFQQPRAIADTLNGFLSMAWSLAGVPGRKALIWATGGFPFDISPPPEFPSSGYLSSLYVRTMQHWMPRRFRFTRWTFAAWSAILRWLTPACLIWTADRRSGNRLLTELSFNSRPSTASANWRI